MIRKLDHLFEANRQWSERVHAEDPQFFSRLATQQSPEYLWIGCSDSRVPANQIIDLAPGEVFVHRNVANVVVHSDLNALSVIQYAVDVLRVKHILVVGHYGCGGVTAAYNNNRVGLVDNWLRHVQDVRDDHAAALERIAERKVRLDRLCELNVMQQVINIGHTTVLREAWGRGQAVTVHGWCYSLDNGLVTDLDISIDRRDRIGETYREALAKHLG
ncbi:MAG: carbonate dehydratase [Rhodocyclaceae bacterium]|nr:carbonate dehydratase [Rhodocyclaceae bacterium]MCW5616470.1 carbonate dehydratase [Rhodocyclaceae bacterium]